MFNPSHMCIGSRARSFRPSRRYELLEGQWEQRRFDQHRQKVEKAGPVIDDKKPISTTFKHVQIKQKKLQQESERYVEVMMNNLILLRHLAEISLSKRVDDGTRGGEAARGKGDEKWKDYYGTILMMRRQQIERLRGMMLTTQQQPQQQQKQEPEMEAEKGGAGNKEATSSAVSSAKGRRGRSNSSSSAKAKTKTKK